MPVGAPGRCEGHRCGPVALEVQVKFVDDEARALASGVLAAPPRVPEAPRERAHRRAPAALAAREKVGVRTYT